MTRKPAGRLLLFAALAAVPAAMAIPQPLLGQVQNGTHPDSHAPPLPPPPPARHPMFFQPAHHVPAHWRMTAGHVRTCNRHYHSYNPRTNRYLGRSGVRHVCVL